MKHTIQHAGSASQPRGVTLLELLVVVLIISILSAMAVNIYIDQVERSRYAAQKAQISALSMAIERYRVDTGEFPEGSTGSTLAPGAVNPATPFVGSGYLYICLSKSLNGQPYAPLSSRWHGPYFEHNEGRLGTLTSSQITSGTSLAEIQILDVWGNPLHYVPSGVTETPFNYPYKYAQYNATQYPSGHPLASYETWFNMSTYQLISFGADGVSESHPYVGMGEDDVANFDGAKKSLVGFEGLTRFDP